MKSRNLILGALGIVVASMGMISSSEALPITTSAVAAPLAAEGQLVQEAGWRRRRVIVRRYHTRRVIVRHHHRRRCVLPFCM
jgi:hypothetical protein